MVGKQDAGKEFQSETVRRKKLEAYFTVLAFGTETV